MSDWRERANCLGTDTEAFFPPPKHNPLLLVKRICNDCTVQAECLDFAMRSDADGVWANTGKHQRNILRKKLGIKIDERYKVA